ncbi:transposase [Mycobacterium tuberculosis]|uniref:transposase n=1 Tax=Mycobacterium tuberculosis TaxID=1773 RepID=UPI0015B59F9D
MCRLHLAHLDQLDAMIGALDEQIEQLMHPFCARRELIASIPGIGVGASATVISEIGADPAAWFPSAEHLASWVRLCPGNHESAGKRHHGARRTGNQHLQPVLVQVRWLPQSRCQQEGDHHRRPQADRHHLARAGHRPASPGSRRRLLHHPHGSRQRTTSPRRQTRSPRIGGHPRTCRLKPRHTHCHQQTRLRCSRRRVTLAVVTLIHVPAPKSDRFRGLLRLLTASSGTPTSASRSGSSQRWW